MTNQQWNQLRREEKDLLYRGALVAAERVVLPLYPNVHVAIDWNSFGEQVPTVERRNAQKLRERISRECARRVLNDYVEFVVLTRNPNITTAIWLDRHWTQKSWRHGAGELDLATNQGEPHQMQRAARYVVIPARANRGVSLRGRVDFERACIMITLPPACNEKVLEREIETRTSAFLVEIIQSILVRFRWEAAGDPKLPSKIRHRMAERHPFSPGYRLITQRSVRDWCNILHEVILMQFIEPFFSPRRPLLLLKMHLETAAMARRGLAEIGRKDGLAWRKLHRLLGFMLHQSLIPLLHLMMKHADPATPSHEEAGILSPSVLDPLCMALGTDNSTDLVNSLKEFGRAAFGADPCNCDAEELAVCLAPLFRCVPLTKGLNRIQELDTLLGGS